MGGRRRDAVSEGKPKVERDLSVQGGGWECSIITGVRNTDREADVGFRVFRLSQHAAVREPIPPLLPAPLNGVTGHRGDGCLQLGLDTLLQRF